MSAVASLRLQAKGFGLSKGFSGGPGKSSEDPCCGWESNTEALGNTDFSVQPFLVLGGWPNGLLSEFLCH